MSRLVPPSSCNKRSSSTRLTRPSFSRVMLAVFGVTMALAARGAAAQDSSLFDFPTLPPHIPEVFRNPSEVQQHDAENELDSGSGLAVDIDVNLGQVTALLESNKDIGVRASLLINLPPGVKFNGQHGMGVTSIKLPEGVRETYIDLTTYITKTSESSTGNTNGGINAGLGSVSRSSLTAAAANQMAHGSASAGRSYDSGSTLPTAPYLGEDLVSLRILQEFGVSYKFQQPGVTIPIDALLSKKLTETERKKALFYLTAHHFGALHEYAESKRTGYLAVVNAVPDIDGSIRTVQDVMYVHSLIQADYNRTLQELMDPNNPDQIDPVRYANDLEYRHEVLRRIQELITQNNQDTKDNYWKRVEGVDEMNPS